MRDEGALTASVHAELIAAPLPFKKGRFQYESNVILDEVGARLSTAPFPALFESLNIDNPLLLHLDRDDVDEAAAGRHLRLVASPPRSAVSSMGWLPKTSRSGQIPALGLIPVGRGSAGRFHFKRLNPGDGFQLQLPNGTCTLDDEAIKRAADILARSAAATSGAGNEGRSDTVEALVKFSGEPLMVSLMKMAMAGFAILSAARVSVGAVMVLEGGQICAMVGGNDKPCNSTAPSHAKRQLAVSGSPCSTTRRSSWAGRRQMRLITGATSSTSRAPGTTRGLITRMKTG